MSRSCTFFHGWDVLASASSYSQLAGLMGGFLFAGMVVLLTERRGRDTETANSDAPPEFFKAPTLMLFASALINLLVSSYIYGIIAGDQVCPRAYMEGIIGAGLMATGALGLFNGIAWLLSTYAQAGPSLVGAVRRTTYTAYITIIALLGIFGVDSLEDMYAERFPSSWDLTLMAAYAAILTVLLFTVRRWFPPQDYDAQINALKKAASLPLLYTLISGAFFGLLSPFPPAAWGGMDDWKILAALSTSLLFVGFMVIVNARTFPYAPDGRAGAERD